MGSKERRIEDMRRNPRNRSMKDIEWLLVGQAGCVKRDGKGSHVVFKHPSVECAGGISSVTVPMNRPLKPRYVENALDYYDALVSKKEDEK